MNSLEIDDQPVWGPTTQAASQQLHAQLVDRVRPNVDLGPWCTYKVGGPAALFVEIQSESDLQGTIATVSNTGVAVLIIGKGSNLLVADRGFDGLVIHLGDGFSEMAVEGTELVVGAAAMLPIVARFSARNGLAGFEWAVGIPGTIGGAVRMNAGGHGSDVASCLVEATVVDLQTGEVRHWTCDQLGFGYRQSSLAANQLVISARFELRLGKVAHSEAKLKEIVQWRRANQPGGQNAGSVFANPEGDSAGRLIDEAGLKGFRIGSAAVSDKHANFIQVDPDGSADDVYAVIRALQAKIQETHGLVLRAENHLIGFENHPGQNQRSES